MKWYTIMASMAAALFLALCGVCIMCLLTIPVKSDEPFEKPQGTSVAIVPEVVEEQENEGIEAALMEKATKMEGVRVSHYCICEICCGKSPDHPAYGVTASGVQAVPGVSVAVDPAVIPLGSDVLVDYGDGVICYYKADDTGYAVTGNHIDLCMGSHEAAVQAGIQTATVYWVAP